jgi:hypothetical protein
MSKISLKIEGLDRTINQSSFIALIKAIFAKMIKLDTTSIQLNPDTKYGGYQNIANIFMTNSKIEELIRSLNNTKFKGYKVQLQEIKLDDKKRKMRKHFNMDNKYLNRSR